MARKLLIAAVLVILVVALGELYGRWVAAESRERVAQIEAALADTTAKLQAAREQERIGRDQRSELREERAALQDSLEEARAQDIEEADVAAAAALELETGTDSLIAMVEPPELRAALETAVTKERGAKATESLSLRQALVRSDSIAASLRLDVASLAADTLSLRNELTLADKQRAAVERANTDLHKEITTLQNKLSPAFVTRLLRTGRDVAIGAGIVTVITVVAK